MNPVKLYHIGRKYMAICPNNKRLAHSFPEIKVIQYLKLASRYLPPVIIGLIVWQYYMPANLILTSISILFALSLPLQGYIWLGKRASTPLPLNLLEWYNKTRAQLIEKQIIAAKADQKKLPDFFDFMALLNQAKIHLSDEQY
ncbi:terminus macrodomain insulation protein YfbV [Orbaceae bacterium ac157xtp]